MSLFYVMLCLLCAIRKSSQIDFYEYPNDSLTDGIFDDNLIDEAAYQPFNPYMNGWGPIIVKRKQAKPSDTSRTDWVNYTNPYTHNCNKQVKDSDWVLSGDRKFLKIECQNSVTWEDAEIVCNRWGGHLGTSTSESDDEIINEMFRVEYSKYAHCGWCGAWIGLKRTNGKYDTWIDGFPVSHTNWANDEPSWGVEDRVGLVFELHGKWNDYWGHSQVMKHIFCEKHVQIDCIPFEWVQHRDSIYQASLCDADVSFDDANADCNAVGGSLAVLKSEGEEIFVMNYLKHTLKLCTKCRHCPACYFWIGLKRDANNMFSWVDGTPAKPEGVYQEQGDESTTTKYDPAVVIMPKDEWFVKKFSDRKVNTYSYVCEVKTAPITRLGMKPHISYLQNFVCEQGNCPGYDLYTDPLILGKQDCAAVCWATFHCGGFVYHLEEQGRNTCWLKKPIMRHWCPHPSRPERTVTTQITESYFFKESKAQRILTYFATSPGSCPGNDIAQPDTSHGLHVNLTECAIVCWQNLNCSGFEYSWEADNYFGCYLKHTQFYKWCKIPKPSQFVHVYMISERREPEIIDDDFERRPGDCVSNDLGFSFEVWVQECADICRRTKDCGGFVYHYNIKSYHDVHCVLKKSYMSDWCRYPVQLGAGVFSYYKKDDYRFNCPICESCDHAKLLLTCGSDKKFYQNPCFLDCAACQQQMLIAAQPVNRCYEPDGDDIIPLTDHAIYTCASACELCLNPLPEKKASKNGIFNANLCVKKCQVSKQPPMQFVDCYSELFLKEFWVEHL